MTQKLVSWTLSSLVKDELDKRWKGKRWDKKLIDYFKPLMKNATNRNTINKDNYIFYFNKLLISRDIKIQNDVVTKEKVFCKRYKVCKIRSIGYKFTLVDI